MKSKMKPFLSVKINTPNETLWEGGAQSISSENSQGKFDVLPLHANMVTLIQDKPIVVRTTEKERRYAFKSAVLYTHDSIVEIYGDI